MLLTLAGLRLGRVSKIGSAVCPEEHTQAGQSASHGAVPFSQKPPIQTRPNPSVSVMV
jgi:hypothetical protein